jgi:protease-4
MKTKNTGLIIFICLIVAALAIAALSVISLRFSSPSRQSSAKNSAKIITNEYIAHVHVSGVIQSSNAAYNQKWLLETIEKLQSDKKNVGIILSIDSPGGTVYEAAEAYLALREYANSGKKVWAYLEQMAASGGYYIACGTDYIIANRNTLTGSIGVIAGQSIDLTGLMNRYGIKVTTITAGKYKNMMGFDSPFTAEQRAIMQSVADECYDQFVEIVSEARGMSVGNVRTLADGRIYTAKQARDAGLVDEIGALDDAIDLLIEECAESGKKIDTQDFKYSPRNNVWNMFWSKFNLIPELQMLKRLPEITYPAYLYASTSLSISAQ